MPGRLPKTSDFPSDVVLSITPPPTSQQPVNILILLHGLGDTYEPFKKLGQQLSLPETACIAVQGVIPLPFEIGGFHWGDDLIFDQSSSQIDPDAGFRKSTEILLQILQSLKDNCGYEYREILFYGFGQGGMAALRVAQALEEDKELSGVISVGGPLPLDTPSSTKKSRTPIIILGGSAGSLITDSNLSRLKSTFEFVEYKRWKRPGDGMPKNREEMLPIMQFFARRLKSRQGVPKGSVEIN
jgi:predicted esterase